MDIGWKVVSTVGGLAAGVMAKQIIEKSWTAVTGRAAPDEDSLESSLVELVAFAAVAGTVRTLLRGLVRRQAQAVYIKSGRSVPVKVNKK